MTKKDKDKDSEEEVETINNSEEETPPDADAPPPEENNNSEAEGKKKEKIKRLPLEKQQLSIMDFVQNNKKTRSESNPYGAAFIAWFKSEGYKIDEEEKDKGKNKLRARKLLSEWESLFKACMNKPIKEVK